MSVYLSSLILPQVRSTKYREGHGLSLEMIVKASDKSALLVGLQSFRSGNSFVVGQSEFRAMDKKTN